MTRILSLSISNFRGIKSYEQKYENKDFICLVGRGDSGKTSILEAISLVFSSSWNIPFTDADFYNGDTNNQIEIIAKIYDFPEKLISESKFSGYCDFLNSQTQDIQEEPPTEGENWVYLLTIKLIVDKNLEPKWYVIKSGNDDKEINSGDRAILNVFLVSDVTNNHFSWTKGSPLFSMLKQDGGEHDNEETLKILRDAKISIDAIPFPHLNDTTQKIKDASSKLGVNVNLLKTSIDFKEITTRDSKVSLHDDKVPFRLKGKGTKRIVSIAIQNELTKEGGITLIDEVEQGLEPDRVKHLIRTLNTHKKGQVFITTHSAGIIEEIDCGNLCLICNDGSGVINGKFIPENSPFQGLMRACPESAYAKKVIVCEGTTELGICRMIDIYRASKGFSSFATKDTVCVLGTGNNLTERVEKLNELKMPNCLFCDSDETNTNSKKLTLTEGGTTVFDTQEGFDIETQVFNDLNDDGIKKLLHSVIQERGEDSIKQSIESNLGTSLGAGWLEGNFNHDVRIAIAKASTNGKEWFKTITGGEKLGEVICEQLEVLGDEIRIKKIITGISNWVEHGS